MTYLEALDYIHSVVWKGSRPGLSRIKELLSLLGNPQDELRFIHIAGTNGKGSVSAMTESILRAAGYRTGLFISPYIKSFNERISYCGTPIDDAALADATATVKPFADSMADAPTEFELITAIGFVYFAKMGCDVVVLETGMGGRLDSTNIIKDPIATVITGISLDHTAYLGNTIAEIAAEKAGIIKEGAPVVWGGRDADARRVIAGVAAEKNAPFIAAVDTPTRDATLSLSGITLSRGTKKDLHVSLMGTYQLQNIATVLSLMEALPSRGITVSEAQLREGLSTVRWRGRFEKLCDQPLIIADGAHNPEGIAAAAESIRAYFKDTPVLLLNAVMADKDYTEMVKVLSPLTAAVFTLTPDNPRALSARELAAVWQIDGIPATAYENVTDAVQAAVSAAREKRLPLISLGSLYMYKEVTEALEALRII